MSIITNEIIQRFNEMSIEAVRKCFMQYVDSYFDEPIVYKEFIDTIIPIINKQSNNDNMQLLIYATKYLPYEHIVSLFTNLITVDKKIVFSAVENKDERVLNYILTNFDFNYLYDAHMSILDKYINQKDILSKIYDILFNKFKGKVLVNLRYYDNVFINKYSDCLNDIGISIIKDYYTSNNASTYLQKKDYIMYFEKENIYSDKEYELSKETITNFSNMTKEGLINCIKHYMTNFNEEPKVYSNYLCVALYYLNLPQINRTNVVNTRLITFNIISKLPAPIVNYILTLDQYSRNTINKDAILCSIRNKDKTVIDNILFNYKQLDMTHYFIINMCASVNDDKIMHKIYNRVFNKHHRVIICEYTTDKLYCNNIKNYVNSLGFDFDIQPYNNIGYTVYLVKSNGVRKCTFYNYESDVYYNKNVNFEELVNKYGIVNNYTEGSKYCVKKNNNTIYIYKNYKNETGYINWIYSSSIIAKKYKKVMCIL